MVSKIVEAGAANEHVENYEIIKYIYMLFREVIKILNREIFMIYILAKLPHKNIKVELLKAVLVVTSKKWSSTDC